MRPSNAEAMALYRSFGFQVVGSRPGYYPDRREDALILRKQLKEEEL
jgi:ribosomal-protein-alanine N-acetyltransferase